MRNTDFSRIAGAAGIAGALLWIVNLIVEYRYGLQPPGSGSLFWANQSGFFLAEIGIVIMLIGLYRSRAAGAGWFGKISTGLFLGGWIVLFVGLGLDIVFALFGMSLGAVGELGGPIGGIASLVGAILTGIAVIRARRWTGWQRYAPLGYAAVDLLVIFVPLAFLAMDPTFVTEAIWITTLGAGLGAALMTGGAATTRVGADVAPGTE